ncbi:TIR-NBS-LRR resistance protein, putative [Medicago truncatula]|uniref:TIR-NBS-LRR resistance protein, putative n=1 Tax=Medicago truncatula TaxID=3880 RepID=A0A072TI82_MEDTR|nr:TIR-NBS-LRR resistance protein, putative [Medicago truncatula]
MRKKVIAYHICWTISSHLNSALRRLDIKTYIDDNLERGDEISQALLKAIDEAKLSVIEVYAEAFVKHEQRFGSTMNILQKWRDALGEAANHSGWHCSINRTEAELVEEIAMGVLQKLIQY